MLTDLFILAITLSIDAFGIGITYGIRNIKVCIKSAILMFCICLILSVFSFYLGFTATSLFPDYLPKIIGCILLICMGIWVILQSIKPSNEISNIINKPELSDVDSSKTIDSKEAIGLGIAISIDSLVCGFGFSIMSDISFIFPILVAFFHVVMLTCGMIFGKKIKSISSFSPTILSRISGTLLILFGLFKIF